MLTPPTLACSNSCGSGKLQPPLLPAAAAAVSGGAPIRSGAAALLHAPSSVAAVREESGDLVKSRVVTWSDRHLGGACAGEKF